MKACSKCKEVKDLDAFNKASKSKDGLHSTCKTCLSAWSKGYYQKNKARKKQQSRTWRLVNSDKVKETRRKYYPKSRILYDKWRKSNPERVKEITRASRLRNQYGLEPSDYEAMVTAQNGVCAICAEPRKLVVDHNHHTGAIRGLLCSKCNSGIGLLRDSAELLEAGLRYLKRYS